MFLHVDLKNKCCLSFLQIKYMQDYETYFWSGHSIHLEGHIKLKSY
jgi:hypothetical protein